MARARAAVPTRPRERNPAFLRIAHPVQPQVFAELGLVSRVELVKADADHDQPDQPNQDPAERGLVSHGARRHEVLRGIFCTKDRLRRAEGEGAVD